MNEYSYNIIVYGSEGECTILKMDASVASFVYKQEFDSQNDYVINCMIQNEEE